MGKIKITTKRPGNEKLEKMMAQVAYKIQVGNKTIWAISTGTYRSADEITNKLAARWGRPAEAIKSWHRMNQQWEEMISEKEWLEIPF